MAGTLTGMLIRFWHELRTWLIVAVITVLIWLYAEGNTLHSGQRDVEIAFVASPKLFVVPPANLGPVTVTYRCRLDRQRDPINLERSSHAWFRAFVNLDENPAQDTAQVRAQT